MPVPQTSEEVAEVVKAVKKAPLKRISEKLDEQIDVAPASHSLPQILNEMGKAIKIVSQECISGRICEQIADDPVPVDQLGDQACRDPQACGVAAKGPSDSDSGKDGGSPAHAVHRRPLLSEKNCGLSDRDSAIPLWSLLAKQEDVTINVPVPQIAVPVPFHKETDEVILPVSAEHLSERTVEQIVDMPVPQIQEQIVEVAQTIPQERTSEHTAEQIAGVPVPRVPQTLNRSSRWERQSKLSPRRVFLGGFVNRSLTPPVSHSQPQILKEVVEVGKAIKIVPQECISGRFCEQIDDDLVPVDQPGDQACRDPQACGVAATGPSDTDGVEDCESPADAVHRHGCRSAYCDTPTVSCCSTR